MELKQIYNQIMKESVNIALATSVKDQPNVRVVTFGYDEGQEGKLFFTTFKGNRKVKEFQQNPRVACLPLPMGPETAAQVRIWGEVKKSGVSLRDMVALIEKKAPEDADTLKAGGDMLEVYEVGFTEAWVTVGMNEAQRYVIKK